MKHLSRLDIEAIAEKYITAYMELPEVQDMQIYRIEPELFLERVLGLKIDYAHLSYDGSLLGMTSFVEVMVDVMTADFEEEHKLYDLTEAEDCPFVLWIGSRRLIKRKTFDEYIEKMYSI